MKKLLLSLLLLLVGVAAAQGGHARMLNGVNTQTGLTYTVNTLDATRIVVLNNITGATVTLPSGATAGFGVGRVFTLVNIGAGTATVLCSSCSINGTATFLLPSQQAVELYSDGTNYIPILSGAGSATSSSTTVTYAGAVTAGNSGCNGCQSVYWTPLVEAMPTCHPATGVYDETFDVNGSWYECSAVNTVPLKFLAVVPLPGEDSLSATATPVGTVYSYVPSVGWMQGQFADFSRGLSYKTIQTDSNCLLGGASGTTSPAACGSASSGTVAVPASQTIYVINESTVTLSSQIEIKQIADNSGLPGSPACTTTQVAPIQTARVPGVSFTFTLNNFAGISCFIYSVKN